MQTPVPPWKKQGWVIPPKENSDFVADMENVLDVYKRPYSREFPVVCMDESPKQLIRETRTPLAPKPGRLERCDYEYERCGVCNIFMASEPLAGRRRVGVTQRRTKLDWARFIKEIAENYKDAKRITLVMDNLGTHKAGSLYEVFPPDEAKRIRDRFEFVYTPKHGSWLNIAEAELSVFTRQCLDRRIPTVAALRAQARHWYRERNATQKGVDWQFTTDDARTKLHRLYPQIQMS